MTRIYIASLNREVREKICRQVYSTEELHQIKALLERSLDQKKKGFSRAVLITMLIAIVLLVTSVLQAGTTPAIAVAGLAIGGIIVITLLFTWYAAIGRLREQYNRALKKGYPQCWDEFHL